MRRAGLQRFVATLRRTAGEETSDRALLAAYATGANASFERLVHRHGPLVLGVCRRVLDNEADAEDAFQATFLVLARKAASANWGESVGGWLYRVACRSALRLRRGIARRRVHEGRVVPRAIDDRDESRDGREFRAVLDEELARLPEHYRLPVLYCCLHDQTAEEAARTLGLPTTTVTSRLQRGRDLLRRRLDRRGLGVGVGLLAVLGSQTASAVPAALVLNTIQRAGAAVWSGRAAELAREILRMMIWAKVRAVAVFVLGVGLLLGGSAAFYRSSATPLPPPANAEATATAPLPESEAVELRGLAVTVAPTRAAFGLGGPLTFEIRYANRSDKPFQLYDVGYAVQSADFLQTGNAAWRSGPYDFDARRTPWSITIPAGEAFTKTYRVNGPFRGLGEQAKPVPPRDALPPGQYQLNLALAFTEPRAEPKIPIWVGKLTTRPVEFRVSEEKSAEDDALPALVRPLKRPAEPAAAPDPAVSVKPTKAVFRPDETPSFQITYANRLQNMRLQLYDYEYEIVHWDLRRVGDDAPWRSIPLQNSNSTMERQPRTVGLAVGEKWTRTVSASGPYSWQGERLASPVPLERLPPGRYRAVASLKFKGNDNKTEGVICWSGERTTPPVEFEVAEKEAASK